MSFAFALEEGPRADVSMPFWHYMDMKEADPCYWIQKVPAQVVVPNRDTKLALGGVPEIDVRTLMNWGSPGGIRTRFLGWPEDLTGGREAVRCYPGLAKKTLESPHLMTEFYMRGERANSWQRLELVQVRGRWYLRCPVNGRLYQSHPGRHNCVS
jgi:hypothetical protein